MLWLKCGLSQCISGFEHILRGLQVARLFSWSMISSNEGSLTNWLSLICTQNFSCFPNINYCVQEVSRAYFKSVPHFHIQLWSIVILSGRILLGFPSMVFLSDFPIKILYTSISPKRATCSAPSYFLWFIHPTNIWWGALVMQLLIVQICSSSSYFIPHVGGNL
jgi:hypothetical protein